MDVSTPSEDALGDSLTIRPLDRMLYLTAWDTYVLASFKRASPIRSSCGIRGHTVRHCTTLPITEQEELDNYLIEIHTSNENNTFEDDIIVHTPGENTKETEELSIVLIMTLNELSENDLDNHEISSMNVEKVRVPFDP
ncbi:hypothetical protein G6F62_012898 [Rhizopus arrhizus]|nr:hypothetical protein G6F24_012337 [Rhizopus arrhizus]KAG0957458.1 hypothetical protein G6F32_001166 [Rhizopus arrhizus]KAG1317439.1 hypothetical protein G6F62_012898 [Rhizopus arrhizus]